MYSQARQDPGAWGGFMQLGKLERSWFWEAQQASSVVLHASAWPFFWLCLWQSPGCSVLNLVYFVYPQGL